ncbi:MAG: type II toxin-antitoxin system RelE/ParE family toxin [Rubrobacteraceae bacterium]
MTRRLVFRPEADLEINAAAEWYEARGQGLAVEFLRVLDACIESIRRNPLLYPVVSGKMRRAVLRRFPYSVIYVVRDDEIVVIACFHGQRDPKRLQDRL